MAQSLLEHKVDHGQKKDDRLIILLGLGLFFIGFYFLTHFHISSSLSFQGFQLCIDEIGELIAVSGSCQSQTKEGELDYDLNIPATLTPFFFEPLPINESDQHLLETLPGIGPRLASQIISTRVKNGPFHSAEDLLHVPGIGSKRMLKYADQFSYRSKSD
jgi:competence ComEA-like helix-hairpin-helix protein